MEHYVKKIILYYFLFGFRYDFMRCVDFTHIAPTNTASDYVTN